MCWDEWAKVREELIEGQNRVRRKTTITRQKKVLTSKKKGLDPLK